MYKTKGLSLVEQKKIQWAKEREEMVGFYGLWGRPRNSINEQNQDEHSYFAKTNVLPPIPDKINDQITKGYRPEDESETSGYLSDSPKRFKQCDPSPVDYQYLYGENDSLRHAENSEEVHKKYWSEPDKTDNFWTDRKSFKNRKNENWMKKREDSEHLTRESFNARMFHNNKNYWYGTPESVSSDEGNRLRWGDRGVGIGHLWEPVINPPNCRLPQMADVYRQTPKWVEKGLKNRGGSQSEVLIISHPGDDNFESKPQKNFILGQNAPIPPEVMEERERKRKKAVEHQNAIKKQLEEREFKRKQEKERRLEEERLEEERIKKEQEIERIRYEEEQRKIREKEEQDKKRERAMKEAIEMAERRAYEEKKRSKNKRSNSSQEEQIKASSNRRDLGKLEKTVQPTEIGLTQRKQISKFKRGGEKEINRKLIAEESKKILKDSSSQFEDIQLANSFQLLNVNGLSMDNGLNITLDNPSNENGFLLPSDSVQLALLMSPRNATSNTNCLLPLSPFSESRTLTPSKFRMNQRLHCNSFSKATQTDFRHSSGWTTCESAGKRRRLSVRCGAKAYAATAQKSTNTEKHKHNRCCPAMKYRGKGHISKLEDRPKWGINRPSVQYKKQSEKDPYYQKRLRERLKSVTDPSNSSDQTLKNDDEEEEEEETPEEKELDSVVRLIKLGELEREKTFNEKSDIILRNGFRMNSALSSPVFVPIDNRVKSEDGSKSEKSDVESDRDFNGKSGREDLSETEEEKTIESNSKKFLTPIQLEAIEKITNLRECLKNLQRDVSNSRSTTPFSEKSTDK